MLSFVVRRLIQLFPIIFFVTALNFVLIHSAPGDPAAILAGPGATGAEIEQIRNSFGLDRPLPEQLGIYFWKVLSGDFGYSLIYGRPAIDLLFERLGATVVLMVTAIVLSLILGIVLGVMSARKPYSKTDNIVTTSSLVLYSLPPFWIGIVFLLVFAFYFRVFPLGGMLSVGVTEWPQTWLDLGWHLVLPAAVLAAGHLAAYTRLVRANMLEVIREDYITMARSNGLSEKAVLFKHALKNALLPVITIAGLQIRGIFTGAVLTETVFGWPGLGRLIFEAISTRDYNLLLGLFFVVSLVTVLASLAADIAYGYADPRIRYEAEKAR